MSACQAANIRYTNDMHPQELVIHIYMSMFILIICILSNALSALPLHSMYTVCNY